MADVRKAKRAGTDDAILSVAALFMRVLIDRYDFTPERIKAFWDDANELSDAVVSGDVKIRDIILSLKEEDDIDLTY